MKKLIVAVLAMICAACSPVATKVNVPDIAKSNSLSVSDVRPADEKERKIFSLMITSKEYGIIRVGDEKLSPSPVRLLQHQVFEKWGGAEHAPVVSVYHFVVYSNAKSQMRSGAIGAGLGGMIGAMIGNSLADHDIMAKTEVTDDATFDKASTDEYQHGLFTGGENPEKASVYIVYIETDINGKKVFTRTLFPMEKHGDQDPLVGAVQAAINNHLAQYSIDAPSVASVSTVASAADSAPPHQAEQPMAAAIAATVPVPPSVPAISEAPAIAPAYSVPVTSTASVSSSAALANNASASMAQGVANQLGCGAVQANGASTFVAPCGSYGVLIDCDSGQCRPMHTIKGKDND
jgi:hypothetical protein